MEESDRNSIVVEDAGLAAGFTMVPNFVLRAPGLSPGAKLVYGLLLSYAWQDGACFPGQERLAGDAGVSDRTVRAYLGELKDAGLVRVEQRGLGKTAVYTLTAQAPREARKPTSGQARKPASGHNRKPASGQGRTPASGILNTAHVNTVTSPPYPRGGRARRREAFDDPGKYTRGRYAVARPVAPVPASVRHPA